MSGRSRAASNGLQPRKYIVAESGVLVLGQVEILNRILVKGFAGNEYSMSPSVRATAIVLDIIQSDPQRVIIHIEKADHHSVRTSSAIVRVHNLSFAVNFQ